jgi:hypothetical protein
MKILSESRIQQVVQQAQLSLYVHERNGSYPEILELVDEMVDLLVEVRRDRAALAEIAARLPEVRAAVLRREPGAELALRMCATARHALGLRTEAAEASPASGRGLASEPAPLPLPH